MKGTQKMKKEKTSNLKPLHSSTSTTLKRTQQKKTISSQIPRGLTAGHTKANSGIATSTHSSKQAPAVTLKNSPKTSLGQTKLPLKQAKKPIRFKNEGKSQVTSKTKEEVKKSLANVIKTYYPSKTACLDVSMTQQTKDTTEKESLKEDKFTRGQFNFIEVVGQGGYGKVWKVQMMKNKKLFAMKEMNKALVFMKKSVDNVMNELKVLQTLRSPFIANIVSAFNDRDNLYLVMDLLPGADLRYRMAYHHHFNEQEARFLIACVITAVDYIHKKKIFHRDIKPQNLVFDEVGYLRLTDFGIARAEHSKQSLDASGTPGYMAPQVLCKQIHSYPVDFYAIGIIAYELMLGKRPYNGANRMEIRDAVVSKQHLIKKNQVPESWSVNAADFVNKLIQRNPTHRLGTKNGARELKNHPWFQGFKWADLQLKKMKSMFHMKSVLMFEPTESNNYDESLMQHKLLQRADQKEDALSGYFFQSK